MFPFEVAMEGRFATEPFDQTIQFASGCGVHGLLLRAKGFDPLGTRLVLGHGVTVEAGCACVTHHTPMVRHHYPWGGCATDLVWARVVLHTNSPEEANKVLTKTRTALITLIAASSVAAATVAPAVAQAQKPEQTIVKKGCFIPSPTGNYVEVPDGTEVTVWAPDKTPLYKGKCIGGIWIIIPAIERSPSKVVKTAPVIKGTIASGPPSTSSQVKAGANVVTG